jgi:hypothetical protein
MALTKSAMSLLTSNQTRGAGSNRADDNPYTVNRYVGGHNRKIHPYISGYWYILIQLPNAIYSQSTDKAVEEKWLHSSAESFNPPSRTLTKVDVPGLGGLGSSFIAGQQLTRTFTCAFREYQDTPVFNTLNTWTSTIDHHYGVSPLDGNEYIPANYKGCAWVFLCKPTLSNQWEEGEHTIDKKDVEQFYFFEGVFPEGAPFDAFTSDISTNDVLQLSVTFSFDGWAYGKEHSSALDQGILKMAEFSTIDTYQKHIEYSSNRTGSTFEMPAKSDAIRPNVNTTL